MFAELEAIAESRRRSLWSCRPIGIVRLCRCQPSIVSLDPEHRPSSHQLLELAERRRDRERIAARDRIPEAALVVVAGTAEDARQLRLAVIFAANDPFHCGAELDDSAQSRDRIDTDARARTRAHFPRSDEHTSELQSLMRSTYAVFCLK